MLESSRTFGSKTRTLLPTKATKHLEPFVFHAEAGIRKVLDITRPKQQRRRTQRSA
jgi:hypothetical protein